MDTADSKPQPAGLFYFLSFIYPVAGYLVGAIFFGKPTDDLHSFGVTCLICAVISQAIALSMVFLSGFVGVTIYIIVVLLPRLLL